MADWDIASEQTARELDVVSADTMPSTEWDVSNEQPIDSADEMTVGDVASKSLQGKGPIGDFAIGALLERFKIQDEYKHAFTNPIDTAKGVVQAFGAAVKNPELAASNIANAIGALKEEFIANPAKTAGTFAMQVANPINLVPMGAATIPAKLAVKGGGTIAKIGATAAGATAGGTTAALTNIFDEGMRAAAEGRELTTAEAQGTAGVGALLGGAMSVPVAALASRAKPKVRDIVDVPRSNDGFDIVNEKSESMEAAERVADPEVQSTARLWVDNAVEGAKQVAYQAGKSLYFRPVQVIRDIGTPAAKKIGDLIYKEERAEKRVEDAPDLIQRRTHAEGEYGQKLSEVLDPISGRFGARKADSRAIVEGLNTGKIEKRLLPTLKKSRSLLEDLYNYQKDAGVDLGRLDNFFPRVYDVPKMLTHKKEFIKMLSDEGYNNPESTHKKIVANDGFMTQDTSANRLLIDKMGNRRVMHEGSSKKPAHEKERSIDAEYSKLKPFLVNDFDAVMSRYIHHATRRAEYTRTFGANEERLNALVSEVVDDYANGRATDNLSVHQAVKAIYEQADALQGRPPRFDSEALNKLARSVGNLSIMIHLPLVALASFPETLAPALHGGIKKYIPALGKGIVDAVWESTAAADKMITGKRHFGKTEWRKSAERMGIVTQHSLNEAWQRRFGGASGKITGKFMRATMLEQMTNVQKIVANEMAYSIIKDLKKGKRTKQKDMVLNDFGLDPTKKHSQLDVDYAAQRWAQKVITDPNEATTPLLMQHPGVNLIFQFKRFITTFSNTLLKSLLQNIKRYPNWQAKAQFIAPAIGMIAIAYYTQYLRDYLKYGDADVSFRKRKEKKKRWLDAIDRSGLTGDMSTYYMLANPYRFGYSDSSAKRLFNLAGPVVGDIAKTGDILSNAGTAKPERQAKAIARLIPGVNIFAPTRKFAEKQIEKAIR